jgi:acetyltransferase-like isoleucine patch superfamily enzyme
MKELSLLFRIKRKLANNLILVIQYFRIKKYSFLSACKIEGNPILKQPILFSGIGKIKFKGLVHIGVQQSPFFLSTYAYWDVRNYKSIIIIEDGVIINNNSFLCSDGAGIIIGKNTIAGHNLEIIDSDFHNTDPDKRMGHPCLTKPVNIGDNVFLGSNVKILKGVSIGSNSVIGSGSIVSKSIPSNVIAAGNPCRVIKVLET